MTILNRLYASSGTEIIHQTIEITDGIQIFRFTNGFEDLVAGIEGGEMVTYTAVGSEFSEPSKNDDGTQDLTFSLSNITGEVSAYIKARILSNTQIRLSRRVYISGFLSSPARPADNFEVKGGSWDALQVSISAGYFDILSTLWPRDTFNLINYPGLRYI